MNKVFVDVDCRVLSNGAIRPQCVRWPDGRTWSIKRTLHSCTSPTKEYEGIRYTVIIGSAEKYIYQTGNKWYVEPAP